MVGFGSLRKDTCDAATAQPMAFEVFSRAVTKKQVGCQGTCLHNPPLIDTARRRAVKTSAWSEVHSDITIASQQAGFGQRHEWIVADLRDKEAIGTNDVDQRATPRRYRIVGYAEQMATPIADIRSWLADAFEGHHLPHRVSI